MSTFHSTVAVVTNFVDLGSGVGSMLRLKIVHPLLDRAGVLHSMPVFPIGVLKTARRLGLTAGLAGFRSAGTAALFGLVLCRVCAVYTLSWRTPGPVSRS